MPFDQQTISNHAHQCTSILKLLASLFIFDILLIPTSRFHSCSPLVSHLPTGCHHLRAPTGAAALSETGNVTRSDQHKPLPKHGSVQPGVRGAAGAAEACFCQQQLQQLQPFPQHIQLIFPSCTSVRAVQQSVYHVR